MKTIKSQKTAKAKVVPMQPAPASAENNKSKHVKAQNTAPIDRTIPVTHDMVAQRAKAIWIAKGCLPGQDEQNWYQAERELRAESKGR